MSSRFRVEGGDADGDHARHRLRADAPGTRRHAYAISPDGNEIAFVADIDPTGVDQNFDVFVVPATGGQARNLTTDNSGDDENPQYSPDGRWLLFTRQTIKGFYGDSYQAWLSTARATRAAGSRRTGTAR